MFKQSHGRAEYSGHTYHEAEATAGRWSGDETLTLGLVKLARGQPEKKEKRAPTTANLVLAKVR